MAISSVHGPKHNQSKLGAILPRLWKTLLCPITVPGLIIPELAATSESIDALFLMWSSKTYYVECNGKIIKWHFDLKNLSATLWGFLYCFDWSYQSHAIVLARIISGDADNSSVILFMIWITFFIQAMVQRNQFHESLQFFTSIIDSSNKIFYTYKWLNMFSNFPTKFGIHISSPSNQILSFPAEEG